jgi:hypothetical protein
VNRDNVKLWVDALRSGLYEQGRGRLSDGTKYCCLGVACEVAIANGVAVDRLMMDDNGRVCVTYDGDSHSLPQSVAKWLGTDRCCPEASEADCDWLDQTVRVGNSAMTVVALNDGHEWTFDQIADAVEETYLRD